jgi:hypothetical protein
MKRQPVRITNAQIAEAVADVENAYPIEHIVRAYVLLSENAGRACEFGNLERGGSCKTNRITYERCGRVLLLLGKISEREFDELFAGDTQNMN